MICRSDFLAKVTPMVNNSRADCRWARQLCVWGRVAPVISLGGCLEPTTASCSATMIGTVVPTPRSEGRDPILPLTHVLLFNKSHPNLLGKTLEHRLKPRWGTTPPKKEASMAIDDRREGGHRFHRHTDTCVVCGMSGKKFLDSGELRARLGIAS